MNRQPKTTPRRTIFAFVLALILAFLPTGSALAAKLEPGMTNAEFVRQVQAELLAFADKDGYREGTPWTDYTPYGGPGLPSKYLFNGWKIGKSNGGVGCAALSPSVSDGVFGDAPARVLTNFEFNDIKVGDMLWVDGGVHMVIVLDTSEAGIMIAEGNYNGTVHWYRVMSRAEVMMTTVSIITRYPEGFTIEPDPMADEVFIDADGEVANGTTDDDLDWQVTNGGTLEIYGHGAMQDYSYDPITKKTTAPWGKYDDKIHKIVFGDGITSLGACAFYGMRIMSITIPDDVRVIGNDAFRLCKNLCSVSTNEGLETIGERAFHSCTALRYIDFPESIKTVGAGAFTSCSELTSVRFKPGTTTDVVIGDNAFTQCWALNNVLLPPGLTRLSAGMFDSCKSLQTLYIPKTVTDLGVKQYETGNGAFTSAVIGTIYFEGTQAEWEKMLVNPVLKATLQNTTVKYAEDFNNPFPMDKSNGLVEDDSTDPEGPENPGETPLPGEVEHEHVFAPEWTQSNIAHWHLCTVEGCRWNGLDGLNSTYASHTFGNWKLVLAPTGTTTGLLERTCTVCDYRESEVLPATGINPGPGDNLGDNTPDKPDPDNPGNTDKDESTGNSKPGNSTGEEKPKDPPSPDDETTTPPTEPDQPTAKQIKAAKSAIKVSLKTKLSKKLNSKIQTSLKKQLKSAIKKSPNATKKQLQKQLNKKFKPNLQKKLKKSLQAELKKPLAKKYGQILGTQTFSKFYQTEFTKQYKKQFSTIYTKKFNSLYKKLKK